ncbi:MAG: hypothetical protein ACHQ50_11705 [Fimbriimonadales bacterium]
MLTIAIAAIAFGFAGPQPPLHCPATLEEVRVPAITMVYGGATFGTCCGGCDAPFTKDPVGLIAKAVKANKTVGAFQFDPVSGLRIEAEKVVAFSDYKAIRYCFTSADEKKSFDAAPAKYVTDIKSETYFCPIMEQDTNFEEAASYADYKGVRYFMCCASCVKKFRGDPAKYVKNSEGKLKALAVVTLKK